MFYITTYSNNKKVCTSYASSEEEAISIAKRIHECLIDGRSYICNKERFIRLVKGK